MLETSAAASAGLQQRLAEAGVSPAKIELAIEQSRSHKRSFVLQLLEAGLLPAERLAQLVSLEANLPLYDLTAHDLPAGPQGVVDVKLIRKHRVLPLYQRDTTLFVAVDDPFDRLTVPNIRFQTGLRVRCVVADAHALAAAIEEYLKGQTASLDDALNESGGLDDLNVEFLDVDADDRDEEMDLREEEQAPVIRFVNKILADMIREGASDIHFEPYERSYRVRARIDGVLSSIVSPPVKVAARLAARLKVMARMDLAERRKPQDGRIRLRLSATNSIDFRVNTLPTLYGEKIVCRVLDSGSAQMGIEALGYEPAQQKLYLDALQRPQGMVLVTGPTGSGKTVSLYTGLSILNTEERNISTAEDPVEINLEGINQVHINPKAGLTFAAALRSFLRQDPDVVMVGEIRDLETAEIAIKAAQTGHLVLSTLHTNSAPETLTRLLNMGVPAFNVASSVSLIIAQRLARRLCPACKKPAELPENILRDEGLLDLGIAPNEVAVMAPQGCPECKGKGQKGRTGIYEAMQITPEISRLIMDGGNSLQIAELAAEQGCHSLRTSALRKVARGEIGLAEANRVTTD
ncbi:MAG: type IV-A pilus assembly ATPase PilB [Cellvibrionales bacterium]|nr:type IV-A pilus assembly ATPase PilB [Cellvibrionales bacterium]